MNKTLTRGLHIGEPLAPGMHISADCDRALGWHYEGECRPRPEPLRLPSPCPTCGHVPTSTGTDDSDRHPSPAPANSP